MGQVIKVDFTGQTSTATRETVNSSLISEPSVVRLCVDAVQTGEAPVATETPSPTVSDAGGQTASPMPTRNAAEATSLVDACARMRADTAALQDAVENLRRATADLHRLPALARELCEAAV